MNLKFLLVSSCIFLATPFAALAGKCGIEPLGTMRIFGTYERQFEMPVLEDEHVIHVGGCGAESYNKYFMIKQGPDVMSLDYRDGYEHRAEIVDDFMDIENSPIGKRASFEERSAHFKKERDFVQSCVLTQVKELGPGPLIQPPQQIGCKVTKIDQQTVRFTGSICYFKLTPVSSFELTYMMNPECVNRDFIKNKNFGPMDVRGGVGFYVVPTADGNGMGDPVARRSIRVAIEPSPDLISLDDDYGQDTLRWPNVVAFDPHFGDLVISKEASDSQMLLLSFLVDNRCKEICKAGMCTSACNRLAPFGAFTNAFEIKPSGKKVYIDSWYTGATLLGQWQGFVPSSPRTYDFDAFASGKKYRVEAKLDRIDDYYKMAEEGLMQFVLDLPDRYPGIIGRDPLPRLNTFPAFSQRIPRFPHMEPLSNDIEQRYDPQVAFWSRLYSISQYMGAGMGWPPYLKKFCNPTYQTCGDVSKGKVHIDIWAEFEIEKFDLQTNKYVLKNLVWGRDSNISSSYKKVGAVPKIKSLEVLPFQ